MTTIKRIVVRRSHVMAVPCRVTSHAGLGGSIRFPMWSAFQRASVSRKILFLLDLFTKSYAEIYAAKTN